MVTSTSVVDPVYDSDSDDELFYDAPDEPEPGVSSSFEGIVCGLNFCVLINSYSFCGLTSCTLFFCTIFVQFSIIYLIFCITCVPDFFSKNFVLENFPKNFLKKFKF